MRFDAAIESLGPQRHMRRVVTWVGGLFIAAIVAMAGYDIVRSYHATVNSTGRELDTQARVIAEQTARSVQAVDVVLRHLAGQFRAGALAALNPVDLHAYLHEQSIGLVQISGLAIFNPDGSVRGASHIDPARQAQVNVADRIPFDALRADRNAGLFIGAARRSDVDDSWLFPLARRLEWPSGEFAGAVGARGRVAYFQQFYADVQPDQGTRITLMHRDGTLVARQPAVESALGRHFPLFDQLLASYTAGVPGPTRTLSPLDGVERFGALQRVPDYPLVVIVTRNVDEALAPWREQSFGTAVRTLALSVLAALLLAVVMRQLSRLYEARESLETSRERFALAVAGSDDGIWDFDFASRRVFASARAREILDMPAGPEMQPMDEWFAAMQLHPDDAPRRLAAMEAHLAGTTPAYTGEFRVRLADGSYRWVLIHGLCIRDAAGRPHRLAGSISDIDARKRVEDSLRQSEERYQLAVEGSNQGLWDWDLAQDTLFLSGRAQELMGLAPGEPLRPRRDWIARSEYHPDDIDVVRSAISAHLRGATQYFGVEYRLRHPGGAWRWYRQRGIAMRDEHGRPYRMAGSMEDITDHKIAEAERVRLEGQLLQAKKLEAIGTLAGGIAHDFNNILAAILGNAEMAQADARAGTAHRRHIDAIVTAGMRAKSLVERILAFSRSGIGDRMPVHVEAVVIEALDLVAASLPAGVRLERRLAAGDARVSGDPTQIHQVVMNLCTNAIQAMKSAGTLAVALDVVDKSDRMAATSALPSGRYVRLSVRDTGSGIAPNVLERIFDPFFTTKEVGVGTGLGLSLVHGIVTDLGGGIDVESRVGEGTTFTVYLPWSSATVASASVDDLVPTGAGETILLVDDEEALVRLGEEMIARLGYEPVGFTSSAAALQTFRAAPERFNAVLSDEAMPEMTGSELAREIRRIRPDVPIVLMSGFVSGALRARARTVGIIDVVAKPLVTRDIARCLSNALRGSDIPQRGTA